MTPPEAILTPRLLLRPTRVADAPAILAAYAADPVVTRFLVWAPYRDLGPLEEFLRRCEDEWARGVSFRYEILLRADGATLGGIHLRPDRWMVDCGYVLARRYWNQGYMTEALDAVAEWALTAGGFFRVQATCDVENPASLRVMEKAGFVHEGILRRWACLPAFGPEPRDCHIAARVR